MATTPDQVRAALSVVTSAAIADTRTVAATGSSSDEVRAALFAAAPLIVSDYSDGTAALALDWYEELREDANPPKLFTPSPLTLVTDDDVRAVVAATTVALKDAPDESLPDVLVPSLRLLEGGMQRLVMGGFRDTMTGNSIADPNALGWRRYARPDACKFCLMAAAKGAVYTEQTARFAAHGDDHCLAGPEFDNGAPLASAIQYVAAKRVRTPEEHANLRDYLNQHFPDAPG